MSTFFAGVLFGLVVLYWPAMKQADKRADLLLSALEDLYEESRAVEPALYSLRPARIAIEMAKGKKGSAST